VESAPSAVIAVILHLEQFISARRAFPGPKDCCGFNSPLQGKSSALFFGLRSVLLSHKRPDSFLRRLFLHSTYVSFFVVCVLR
jgi:hypothetical protein